MYETFELADYLKPRSNRSVEDKRLIFSLRTEMNEIPSNFRNPTKCGQGCEHILTNKHILECDNMNNNQTYKLHYENILN